jgi:ankyrin repeat protein
MASIYETAHSTAAVNGALHSAAREGNRESVTLLLQRGANRDIKDTWGRTAAERAVQYGHHDIAELIETFTPRL